MFQTQQAQAQAHPQSHSTWDTAEETNTMDVNETVSPALPTMTSLGSMGSMDGILEDMIMSDTVLPLEATDDIIHLSTYDEDTTMEEESMMEDAPTATAPGASRSLTRVVSKDSKGEAVAYPQGSPFPPASAATVPAMAAPSQPAQQEHPEDFSFDKFFANPHDSHGAPSSLQPVTPFHPEPPPLPAAAAPTVTPPTPPKPHQHPEDFSFDKFFAHYDLPSQLQPPPNPEAAPLPKKKRSHRRAHTVGAYHAPMLVEGVYPETIAPQAPGGVPAPMAVHTIPAPAEITTPVVPAAPAPPTSTDPIMAFLTTNNNASPPITRASIDDSHQVAQPPPLKRKGHHRRIRSEGSAAFGNNNNNNNNANLFFTNTGITNVLLELAADKPVPKDSTTCVTTTASDVARTTTDRMASTPGSLGPASLVGTALEAVPEKKAIVSEVLPNLHNSHTNHLGGSSSGAENEVAVMAEVDPRQFMNHGTEAAWLENLQNSPVAGA